MQCLGSGLPEHYCVREWVTPSVYRCMQICVMCVWCTTSLASSAVYQHIVEWKCVHEWLAHRTACLLQKDTLISSYKVLTSPLRKQPVPFGSVSWIITKAYNYKLSNVPLCLLSYPVLWQLRRARGLTINLLCSNMVSLYLRDIQLTGRISATRLRS